MKFNILYQFSTGVDTTIKDVDYGICRHKFMSPQQGFDKNVQRQTLRKSITPYVFFNNWIKNKEDVFLLKGTPYADQGKIWMDYIVYNNQSTEFIQIKVVRTPQK